MKIRTMRIVSLMLAIVCLIAMLPASSMTAFATAGDVSSESGDAGSLPVITKQPEDVYIVCGEDGVFTIGAEGEGLTYQWYFKSGDDSYRLVDNYELSGTKTAAMTAFSCEKFYMYSPDYYNGKWTDAQFNGGEYYCVVTNANGSVVSDIAVLHAEHNSKGEQNSDLNSHWSKCTCSYGDELVPVRDTHVYENGKCTVCGASETSPRLAGGDRCETAALISSSAYESAENVVIASGNDYADALAGVSLAYALDAPILLLRGSSNDISTINEIDRLGAKNIYILGGAVAVSQEYEDLFTEYGYNVTRIAGASRFDTAVEIAKKTQEISGAPEEIFFAYSHNYPDALAISGIAAVKGSPVLYIAANGVLSETTAAYVSDSDAATATILGGTIAVSADAETNIAQCGIGDVQRIAGDSRYETNIKINESYADVLTGEAICVATGVNYPDALAGGVLAAIGRAPIVLVGASLSDVQTDYVSARQPSGVIVFGGTIAVSDRIVEELVK